MIRQLRTFSLLHLTLTSLQFHAMLPFCRGRDHHTRLGTLHEGSYSSVGNGRWHGLGAVAVQGLHAQAKPPAFLIFDAEVKDKAAYQPFLQTAVKEVQAQGVSSSCSVRPQMYSAEVHRPIWFR